MQIEEPVFRNETLFENSVAKNYLNKKYGHFTLGSISVLDTNAYDLSKQESRYRKVD